MKILGQTIPPPSPEKITLYRESGPIVLTAQAILSFDEFDALCPAPKPPVEYGPDKKPTAVRDDPEYLKSIGDYSRKRQAWEFITSLSATEGLEWDTVKINDPNTWLNYEKDLKTCFTEEEIGKIILGTMEANNPSEKKRKEAFESFTPTQAPVEDQPTTQKEEQSNS